MNNLYSQNVERLTVGNNLTNDILTAIDIISNKHNIPISSEDFRYGLDKYFYVDKSEEIVDYSNDTVIYQYTVYFETINGGACYMIELDHNKNPTIVDADENASNYLSSSIK
jgi:hypothetical protein